eukprot:c14360_g1_i1.p1 GENE.c14360_g1_i1~~c14360_g1_i1.p1  ORF type:complete len:196 (+),score=38.41 c14360_g1_i1:36-623(+)
MNDPFGRQRSGVASRRRRETKRAKPTHISIDDLSCTLSDDGDCADSETDPQPSLDDETLGQSADHLFFVLLEMFPNTTTDILQTIWAKHRPNLEVAAHHAINLVAEQQALNSKRDRDSSLDGELVDESFNDWPGLTLSEANFLDEWSVVNQGVNHITSHNHNPALLFDQDTKSDDVSSDASTMMSSWSLVDDNDM